MKMLIRIMAPVILMCSCALGEERFPPPDFEKGYRFPITAQPAARYPVFNLVDAGVLAAALCAAAFIALKRRNHGEMLALSVFSLVYFGFYRHGCTCSVGSIQNVALAIADPRYVIPWEVLAFFSLPLLFALLFGRVFCAGVCPLGAVQDIVLLRPVRVPSWLQRALGVLPYMYLGVAVLLAATGSMFIVCRWDPFVAFFRLSGGFWMLVAGGMLLILSTFVGRPYCRFACPYGAILGVLSRISFRHVSTTPDDCVVCSLCEEACPFGAIGPPPPEGVQDIE